VNATLITADLAGMPPGTNLYHLETPLEGFDYVTITAVELFGQAVVVVVGCNQDGYVEAPTMESLWQSDVYLSHAEVLAALGYIEEVPA
jgi:hypothetical protein